MWEGQALPHDTKFGNSRCEIVGRSDFYLILDPWITLIRFDKSRACSNNFYVSNSILSDSLTELEFELAKMIIGHKNKYKQETMW